MSKKCWEEAARLKAELAGVTQERDKLAAALNEAIGWIEEEDPYDEVYDDVRQNLIVELRTALPT